MIIFQLIVVIISRKNKQQCFNSVIVCNQKFLFFFFFSKNRGIGYVFKLCLCFPNYISKRYYSLSKERQCCFVFDVTNFSSEENGAILNTVLCFVPENRNHAVKYRYYLTHNLLCTRPLETSKATPLLPLHSYDRSMCK